MAREKEKGKITNEKTELKPSVWEKSADLVRFNEENDYTNLKT